MDQTAPLRLMGGGFFDQFHGLTIGRNLPETRGVSDLGFPALLGA